MVYETVAPMIAKQLRVDLEKVTRESRLVEDLKADSANIMVMIMDWKTNSASWWRTTSS